MNDEHAKLQTWQVVVGATASVLPPVLAGGLLGAVLLRIAYGLCIGRGEEPPFARAWWISVVIALLGLPFYPVTFLVSAISPVFGFFVGCLGAMLVFAFVYRQTLRVSFGQGALLWFVQLIMILPIYAIVVVLAFQMA